MVSSRSLAAWCVLGLLAGYGSVARADQIDNPLYKSWASFKVGSTKTLDGTINMNGMESKAQMTYTLKEVAADHVTVDVVTNMTIMGQSRQLPATPQTYPAKIDDKDIKYLGEEDVEAMGKTFKCKVWTMHREAMGAVGAAQTDGKAWTADEVPGAVVKLEVNWQRPGAATTRSGKITYIISSYEAK